MFQFGIMSPKNIKHLVLESIFLAIRCQDSTSSCRARYLYSADCSVNINYSSFMPTPVTLQQHIHWNPTTRVWGG